MLAAAEPSRHVGARPLGPAEATLLQDSSHHSALGSGCGGVHAALQALCSPRAPPHAVCPSEWESSAEGATGDRAAGAQDQHSPPAPDAGRGWPPPRHCPGGPGLLPSPGRRGCGIGSPGAKSGLEAQVPFFLTQEKLRQPCLLSSSLGTSASDGVAGPPVRQLWHGTIGSRRRWRGHALQRRLLERQLMMAVSPWVGDVVLPCFPRRPATVHTRGTAPGLR